MHSSHTINEQFCKTFAESDPLCIYQIGLLSLVKDNGNLNVKCAVLPPGSRVIAIPVEATATATLPFDLILAIINLVTNVFLVLPGASRNIRSPCWVFYIIQVQHDTHVSNHY